MQSTTPDLYMNMQQFSALKLQARRHSADAATTVARQFEGLFMQMMLKNMRAAAVVDKSLHSSNMDFYTEMYDKQLSQVLARQGGIGIADLLQRQLQQEGEGRQRSTASGGMKLPEYRLPVAVTGELPMTRMDYQAKNPAVRTHPLIKSGDSPSSLATTRLRAESIKPFGGWPDASSFVRDLWPHAEQAANRLGVSAQVLVAQSALETGWGQHAMRKADGSVAFNLFGIKAGNDWYGQSVVQQTLEFRRGAMQRESASFRAYDSVADALDDYVSFVQNRSRYRSALQHGGSDEHYIRGLQQAGYATDPDYASKILSIMNGGTLHAAVTALNRTRPVLS